MTEYQIKIIRRLVHSHFGEDSDVWLFGSRVDDGKKGGDYDFLIETSLKQPDVIIEQKIALLGDLQTSAYFEDEKIDLIVKRRDSKFDIPIYSIAKKEGIRL